MLTTLRRCRCLLREPLDGLFHTAWQTSTTSSSLTTHPSSTIERYHNIVIGGPTATLPTARTAGPACRHLSIRENDSWSYSTKVIHGVIDQGLRLTLTSHQISQVSIYTMVTLPPARAIVGRRCRCHLREPPSLVDCRLSISIGHHCNGRWPPYCSTPLTQLGHGINNDAACCANYCGATVPLPTARAVSPRHLQEENMLLRAQPGEEVAHVERAIVVSTIPLQG
jgi:hypothetical protein